MLRETTPESVDSLSINDVKDYYLSVFRPDLTTIVVIGNISTEKAKEIIGKYLGEWKALGALPKTELPSVPQNRASVSAVPDESRVSG